VSREFCTIVFCCEQRFSVHFCICGLWLLIRGGTELLEVLGTEGQDIRRYPGAR
jgi:hypothetical protein